ncbi:MAG: DNA repair protein RadA [Bacteroidetes bacterium]|nr:DNA repair protein RadA [Bacteroidota bacterium]
MSKVKKAFFCAVCGVQSPKWIGKCPSCGEWNSYHEEILKKETGGGYSQKKDAKKAVPIGEVSTSSVVRIQTGIAEFDNVLGGGIVPGSVILLGGEPGIGKSTLLLQAAIRNKAIKSLYITGEENEQQIKMRAERIGIVSDSCFILHEVALDAILESVKLVEPDLLIIDSIQTVYSSDLDSPPGTVSQVRESAASLQRFAKESGVPVVLIGHITKEGVIAGPKLLEHMVDTVLQFEGDRNHVYRILRSVKNRFGSTSEIGIFEMLSAGLREVSNPSEILVTNREEPVSGVACGVMVEGQRPFVIEIQALVSSAVYGTPQRSSTGFDQRRLNMLLAVLEKRCGFRLSAKDVFLNISGGLRVDDPALDLAVVSSILSSSEDFPLNSHDCFAAEVGLTGEIRPVTRIEQRINEAVKLGYERIFISRYNTKGIDETKVGIQIEKAGRIEDVFHRLFG